ncbi:E3 ubiquitin-protein ligase znrf3 [Blyttiomyces sp. JEL0837]|nr:E3 ubiquitin-protein ligase znrf3 [Blyttiomyces sp. JEL0837]
MADPEETRSNKLRSLTIDVVWNVSFIALNATFLSLFYPSETNPNLTDDGTAPPFHPENDLMCEQNVVTYLIGQLVLYTFYSLPQKPLQYFIETYRPDLRRHPVVMTLWTVWSIVTLFDICWFLAGQVWVFKSKICRTHDRYLYWLAVAEIAFFYLTTILPLIFYIILVMITRRRRQRALEAAQNGPAAHLRGGLSKTELASLRTFLFRPNLAVVPEGDRGVGPSGDNGGIVEEDQVALNEGKDGYHHGDDYAEEVSPVTVTGSGDGGLGLGKEEDDVRPVVDDTQKEMEKDAVVVVHVEEIGDEVKVTELLKSSSRTSSNQETAESSATTAESLPSHVLNIDTPLGIPLPSGSKSSSSNPHEGGSSSSLSKSGSASKSGSVVGDLSGNNSGTQTGTGTLTRPTATTDVLPTTTLPPSIAISISPSSLDASPSKKSISIVSHEDDEEHNSNHETDNDENDNDDEDSSSNPPTKPDPEEPLPPGASTTCAICFSDFEPGDRIRELACRHLFHAACIDPWLIAPEDNLEAQAHRTCPLCVREAILPEFRDPEVELAMEAAREEEVYLQEALERSRREADELRALQEARAARAEERRRRRRGLFGRGRSVESGGEGTGGSNAGSGNSGETEGGNGNGERGTRSLSVGNNRRGFGGGGSSSRGSSWGGRSRDTSATSPAAPGGGDANNRLQPPVSTSSGGANGSSALSPPSPGARFSFVSSRRSRSSASSARSSQDPGVAGARGNATTTEGESIEMSPTSILSTTTTSPVHNVTVPEEDEEHTSEVEGTSVLPSSRLREIQTRLSEVQARISDSKNSSGPDSLRLSRDAARAISAMIEGVQMELDGQQTALGMAALEEHVKGVERELAEQEREQQQAQGQGRNV